MKAIIQENKDVIRFIVVFLLLYSSLSAIYGGYLKSFSGIDPYSELVAEQSVTFLNLFGFSSYGELVATKKQVKIFINGSFSAFISEGCNAISIMILFVSFVVSFARNVGKTLWFLGVGLAVIILANLLRIVLMTSLIYNYPELTELMHNVIFPGVIYGTVFLLWMYWVNTIKKEKHARF